MFQIKFNPESLISLKASFVNSLPLASSSPIPPRMCRKLQKTKNKKQVSLIFAIVIIGDSAELKMENKYPLNDQTESFRGFVKTKTSKIIKLPIINGNHL
mgnify:CR=1 FL=1